MSCFDVAAIVSRGKLRLECALSVFVSILSYLAVELAASKKRQLQTYTLNPRTIGRIDIATFRARFGLQRAFLVLLRGRLHYRMIFAQFN